MGKLLVMIFNWLWEGIFSPLLTYTWNSIVMSFEQMLILLGPCLVLAFLMHIIAGFVESRAINLMGTKKYLWLFGWLGTSVHELGHLTFCIIFRYKVNDVKLFDLDPDSNVLGYVKYSRDPTSTFQSIGEFFVGIGPIVFGSLVIYYLTYFLLGQDIVQSLTVVQGYPERMGVWQASWTTIRSILDGVVGFPKTLFVWQNLLNWRTYLFLYILFCIGSAIKLSMPDISGAVVGFITILVTLFLLNFFTMWLFEDGFLILFKYTTRYYTVFYIVMVFALVMNLFVAALLVLIGEATRMKGRAVGKGI